MPNRLFNYACIACRKYAHRVRSLRNWIDQAFDGEQNNNPMLMTLANLAESMKTYASCDGCMFHFKRAFRF